MQEPKQKPKTLCMAPWTHTYLSPQTERRMCCASREPAQNFEQYIDTDAGTGTYQPMSLEEHWNSEHMKSVRRRMMAGETLPECQVCNDQLLNTDVYRTYFDHLFSSKYYKQIWEDTDETGHTRMKPVSWDYRFSNLCNFKCRMCGDMLSSSWEAEQRKHNMINWDDPKNNWMRPEIKKEITQFQQITIEQEFAQAVEEHRVEEIYWVGGEPLMYEQHWKYMQRIIELGDGPNVYARYNTNLSRVVHNNISLFDDLLPNLRDWQICASIDGTEKIGEYIRTGLNFDRWSENYDRAVKASNHGRQVRIDFTLTLPGLFEVEKIQKVGQRYNTQILSKVIFSFTPDIVMSPLALPKHILHPWVDELLPVAEGAMHDVLTQLKMRPTFQEQWPNEWEQGLKKGKARIERLEQIRKDTYTMRDILSMREDALQWWEAI